MKQKPYVTTRFGFYSVRNPDGTIVINATNVNDANAVFKKMTKRNLKNEDFREY